MAKGNILKESIIEARALKQAAIRNAENSLAEHFRGTLEEMVDAELNEEADMDTGDESCDDEVKEEAHMEFDPGNDVMSETDDMDEDDLLGDEGYDEEEGDEEEDFEPQLESLGFSEAELRETIYEIFNEVEHGSLGEPEDIDPDTHDTGLMDQDSKEDGWETKTPPAKKDWTVKESYRKMKALNVKLIAENKSLRKSMAHLREAVEKTNLFNKKLFLAQKLMNKHRLSEDLKRTIVSKIDSARSSSEAERIYESFESVLGVMSEGKKQPSRKTATLSETLGYQKKSEKGLTHINDQHLLSEDGKYSVHRMQVLAGLKKEDL